MKSGKKLAELIEVLRTGDAIRKKKMTVYGVTNCGMESERVLVWQVQKKFRTGCEASKIH